jgi:hypothetical protein
MAASSSSAVIHRHDPDNHNRRPVSSKESTPTAKSTAKSTATLTDTKNFKNQTSLSKTSMSKMPTKLRSLVLLLVAVVAPVCLMAMVEQAVQSAIVGVLGQKYLIGNEKHSGAYNVRWKFKITWETKLQ